MRHYRYNGQPVTIVDDYAYCTKVTCTDKGKFVWVTPAAKSAPWLVPVAMLEPIA